MIPLSGKSPMPLLSPGDVPHRDPGRSRANDGGLGQNGIEIDHLFGLFWRRRTLFCVVALVILLPAIAAILSLPRLYTASARLMIEARPSRMVDILPVVGTLPDDRAAVLSELEVIRSPELAREVIKALDLDQKPEFNDTLVLPFELPSWLAPSWHHHVMSVIDGIQHHVQYFWSSASPSFTPEQVEARVIEAVLKQLDAVSLGESRVIEVSFTARDPQLAAQVANAMVEAYVERRRQLRLTGNQDTNRWLNERLQAMQDEVRKAELDVERFREETVLGQGLDLEFVNRQLEELGTLIVRARAEVESRRAELTKAQDATARLPETSGLSLFASPMFDRLRANLADIRRRRAELTNSFGEQHPAVRTLDEELRSVERQLSAEVKDVISGFAAKLSIAEDELNGLQSDLDRLQHERLAAARANIQLDALQRTVDAKRSVLTTFLQREQETAQITSEKPQVEIISTAIVPSRRSQPKLSLLLLGAFMAAGIGGIGAVLGAENMRRTGFLSLDEIEQSYALPVHAVVPMVASKRLRKAGGSIVADAAAQPSSMACEALRAISLGLVGAVRTRGLSSCVMFVSAMPAEGKSSLTAGTAVALANAGWRVLVIDADPHRHQVSRLLKITGSSCLTDLMGDCAVRPEDLVQRSPVADLHVVALGESRSGLAHALGSPVVLRAIDRLKQDYDFVLIDAPPVLPVSETRLLMSITQHCVMVVRWKRTSRKAIDHALRLITGAGGWCSGVVMNQVDIRAMAMSDYTEAHLLSDRSYRRYFVEGGTV